MTTKFRQHRVLLLTALFSAASVPAQAVVDARAAVVTVEGEAERQPGCQLRLEQRRFVQQGGDSVPATLGAFGGGVTRVHWQSDSARYYSSRYRVVRTASNWAQFLGAAATVAGIVTYRRQPRPDYAEPVMYGGAAALLAGLVLQSRAERSLRTALRCHNAQCAVTPS
ncbi:MAG: hypothetical protein M3373_10300 [Gemmatimonadota bacterium]|nr:hypothetical protein [Gemmatimonadota bacterium]